MLYETLHHPKLLIIFILTGLSLGLLFDIGNFIKFLFSNKKIPSIIIDFIQTSISLLYLFMVNLKYNYGSIRLFPILIFFLSFSIERLTIGKIVAKFYLSCYNLLTKFNKRLWSKIKNGKTNKTN